MTHSKTSSINSFASHWYWLGTQQETFYLEKVIGLLIIIIIIIKIIIIIIKIIIIIIKIIIIKIIKIIKIIT